MPSEPALISSLAAASGLRELPTHLSTFIASVLAFTALHLVLAPGISRAALGRARWAALTPRTRRGWSTHVVSLVHAVVVIVLAGGALDSPVLDAERVLGWDACAGRPLSVAAGYFLWDTVVSAAQFDDVGFLVHALACFTIYFAAFKPFLAYYAIRFLLWELSTPFLNIHWFLDKLGKTGTRLQLVNGVFLLATFASMRLVYGPYMSYQFFRSILAERERIHPAAFVAIVLGNIVLNALNILWFSKMIGALARRFNGGKRE